MEKPLTDSKIDVTRALLASVAAGDAYLASMWLDNRLSSHPFNDIKLTGQILTTKSPAWQIMGLANHFSFSVAMSLVYAAVCDRLPGPPWLRGVLFMQVENTVLYPLAGLLEPRHAGFKSGQLPTLFSRKSFQGQALRHLAFGLVLGTLYRPRRSGVTRTIEKV